MYYVRLESKESYTQSHDDKKYVLADLEFMASGELTCLTIQSEDAYLWHRMLGYVSSSLPYKFISKNLVCGLPKLKFPENKFYNICAKGEKTRPSFKMKK